MVFLETMQEREPPPQPSPQRGRESFPRPPPRPCPRGKSRDPDVIGSPQGGGSSKFPAGGRGKSMQIWLLALEVARSAQDEDDFLAALLAVTPHDVVPGGEAHLARMQHGNR